MCKFLQLLLLGLSLATHCYSQEQVRAVFMGNSITELWAQHRPQFFDRNNYLGRGISGQTSGQMLLRFRKDVLGNHPQVVVICAGTNDVAENGGPYNAEQTMDNIKSMADLARAHHIKVVLCSVLPAARFKWRPAVADAPEKIADLNRRIRSYAEQERLPYVDYHAAMLASDGRSLQADYTYDGVHPTQAGFAVMEPLVEAVLNDLLKQQ
jgi:lysophospholipase L1-like esterase